MKSFFQPEDRQSFLYAVPYLTHALAMTPLITFIPSFYADAHGLSLALVGAILFFTRLTDIITEPLIGILSDRTKSRFGRRKPWIVAGLPFLMLGIWMVFAPPFKVTAAYAIFWIAVTYIAFNVVDTPYKAWGAELSKSYSGRTRVAGWREGFGIASSMSALGLIFFLQSQGMGSTADLMFWLGTSFVVLMPLLFAVGLFFVAEPDVEVVTVPPVSFREATTVLFSNKPFMRLLGGLIVLMAGAIIGASLHLIVMEKVFNAKHLFPIILAGENIAGLLSLPFWLWLSKRIGKHRALAIGTLSMALLSFPIPLIDHDRPDLYAACIIIRGFAGGALGILVSAMIADVVDLDTLKTGKARNGLYFALVGTLGKFGLAFGALIGTSIPALAGFAMTGSNTDAAIFSLMATYAWLPMLIMGLATPFFWFYPLTEAVQRDLRAQIDARRMEENPHMTDANVSAAASGKQRDIIPKAEQARRTRALIVETGIRCLAQHGFASTTMLLISKEAGISRGPLHYHFADRNELMAAIAEALPRGVSRKIMTRLLAPKTPEARLKTMVDFALGEHLGPHHFAAMELLLAARNDTELAKAIQPHFLESETLSDEWWIDYFGMLHWPADRLIAFRHVAVATLRGLALDYLLHGDAEAHKNALELFREMFIAFGRSPGRMIELALSLVMGASVPTPVVETLAGPVEGLIEQSIFVYRGIPYAKPPVDSLRWRAPQIPERWTSKRIAHEFGAVCMQADPKSNSGVGLERPSEDCLTLNIWAPLGGAAQHPVMIWIHGGGYVSGSGSAPLYDGSALASRGVLVVTFNYRLGRFGFFDHPELAKLNEGANFGLLDQRAAFQWVRDNIAAFGGDPNQITLFGNSAGGESILFHMTSPSSRGLFHRAIVQSGLGGRDLLKSSASVDPERAPTQIADLRALKASDVIGWGTPSLYRGFGPTIDGIVINGRIEDAFREHSQARVPLIIGYSSLEIPPASIGGTKVALALVGHDEKQRASGIAAYGEVDLYEQKIASDALFRMPAIRLGRLHARAGNSTWAYEFDVVAPSVSDRLSGAPHASERAYIFNTLQALGWGTDERDAEISHEMADRWVAFAKTSKPGIPSAPWPRLNSSRPDILVVTRDGKPRDRYISPLLSRYFRLP